MLYDITRGVVVEVANERKKASLEGLFAGLSEAQRHGVKAVCMDMWEPFAKATAQGLPDEDSKIVHDRFYVMQHANKAVRIAEGRALFKTGDDTPEKRRAVFESLVQADLKTAKAWAAKEALWRTWKQPTVEAAREHVNAWLKHVAAHVHGPMHTFSLLMREKLEPIIRY